MGFNKREKKNSYLLFFLILSCFYFTSLFFGAGNSAFARVVASGKTIDQCEYMNDEFHTLIKSVTELDRISRFYTSAPKMTRILSEVDKAELQLKKYRKVSEKFSIYIDENSSGLKRENLIILVKMNKKVPKYIEEKHNVKLQRYFEKFRALLKYSIKNVDAIKKKKRSLERDEKRKMYDFYFMKFKRSYNEYFSSFDRLELYLKKNQKKYPVLTDLFPIERDLFQRSIWKGGGGKNINFLSN